MRMRVATWVVMLLMAAPAAAQQAKPSVVSIDSSTDVDVTVDANGNQVTGVFLDTLTIANLGRNVQAIVRPQVQRLANSGEWNRQIWVAELRYERPGAVAVRVEGGYIPSPVGLANLALRPHMNPTIALPAELFTCSAASIRSARRPRSRRRTGTRASRSSTRHRFVSAACSARPMCRSSMATRRDFRTLSSAVASRRLSAFASARR